MCFTLFGAVVSGLFRASFYLKIVSFGRLGQDDYSAGQVTSHSVLPHGQRAQVTRMPIKIKKSKQRLAQG